MEKVLLEYFTHAVVELRTHTLTHFKRKTHLNFFFKCKTHLQEEMTHTQNDTHTDTNTEQRNDTHTQKLTNKHI